MTFPPPFGPVTEKTSAAVPVLLVTLTAPEANVAGVIGVPSFSCTSGESCVVLRAST